MKNSAVQRMKKGGKPKDWFLAAIDAKRPYHLGWKKDMTEKKRRAVALSSRPKNWKPHTKYLSVARALQALSNVTKDTETKKLAKKDSKYFFVKAKATKTKMENGGKIDNQYEGKTEEQIWGAWTKPQREHFLLDHVRSYDKYVSTHRDEIDKEYKDISFAARTWLKEHVEQGQYKEGGSIKESDLVVGKKYDWELEPGTVLEYLKPQGSAYILVDQKGDWVNFTKDELKSLSNHKTGSMNNAGKMHNQYEGKNSEQVWNGLDFILNFLKRVESNTVLDAPVSTRSTPFFLLRVKGTRWWYASSRIHNSFRLMVMFLIRDFLVFFFILLCFLFYPKRY